MSTNHSKAFFGPANRRAAGSLWKVLKLASTGHVPAGPVGEKYSLVLERRGEGDGRAWVDSVKFRTDVFQVFVMYESENHTRWAFL